LTTTPRGNPRIPAVSRTRTESSESRGAERPRKARPLDASTRAETSDPLLAEAISTSALSRSRWRASECRGEEQRPPALRVALVCPMLQRFISCRAPSRRRRATRSGVCCPRARRGWGREGGSSSGACSSDVRERARPRTNAAQTATGLRPPASPGIRTGLQRIRRARSEPAGAAARRVRPIGRDRSPLPSPRRFNGDAR